MGRIIAVLLLRLAQVFGRILFVSGLLLLAVILGIFGGLWHQSDSLTKAIVTLTGLSVFSGFMPDGPLYWSLRVLLFALLLVFWVISCFGVVWVVRLASGFRV